jgi:hypothetical protein
VSSFQEAAKQPFFRSMNLSVRRSGWEPESRARDLVFFVNGSNAWNQETKKKRRWPMRFVLKSFMPMVLAAAIAAPVFVTG